MTDPISIISAVQNPGATHYPEQPNPAAPYLDFARNFATGGLHNALAMHPDLISRVLQNPDNIAAIGRRVDRHRQDQRHRPSQRHTLSQATSTDSPLTPSE